MKLQVYVRLCAPNDNYGNPRRVIVVSEVDNDCPYAGTKRLAVIDEGYVGESAVRQKFPNALRVNEVNISAGEYRRWMRVRRADEELKQEERCGRILKRVTEALPDQNAWSMADVRRIEKGLRIGNLKEATSSRFYNKFPDAYAVLERIVREEWEADQQ